MDVNELKKFYDANSDAIHTIEHPLRLEFLKNANKLNRLNDYIILAYTKNKDDEIFQINLFKNCNDDEYTNASCIMIKDGCLFKNIGRHKIKLENIFDTYEQLQKILDKKKIKL